MPLTSYLIVYIPFYLLILGHSLHFILHLLISLPLLTLSPLLLLSLCYLLHMTFWFPLVDLLLWLPLVSHVSLSLLTISFLLVLYLHYLSLCQFASLVIYLGCSLVLYCSLVYVSGRSQILIDIGLIVLVSCLTSSCSWNIWGFYDHSRSQICLVHLPVNASTFLDIWWSPIFLYYESHNSFLLYSMILR